MNLERQIDHWFNKLEKGILTPVDKNIDLTIKLSAIARSIDVAIFPFMVATHFKYKNLTEINAGLEDKWYLNIEQYKTTEELIRIYLFDRMLRNLKYQTKDEIIKSLNTLLFGNNPTFQDTINSNMREILYNRDKYGSPYEVLKYLKYSLSKYEKKKQGGVSTPIELVRVMTGQVTIKDGNSVLDPACGHGTFLLVAHEQNPKAKYFGVDISPQRCYIAKYVVPFAEIWCGDFLKKGFFMKKIDNIVGNPPFHKPQLNSKDGSNSIFQSFFEKAIDIGPSNISLVTPSSMFRSKKYSNLLKKAYSNGYGFSNVQFLSERYMDVAIDCVSFLACNQPIKYAEVKSCSNETFKVHPQIDILADLQNQDFYDFVINIQTEKKWFFNRQMKNQNKTRSIVELKITKGGPKFNKCNSTQISVDEDKYRVAIGFNRTNNVVVVPPGITIPGKYVSISFNTEKEAENFRDYLLSPIIKTIILFTYTMKTASNSQFYYIPVIDMNFDANINEHLQNVFNPSQTILNFCEQYKDCMPY